MTGAPGSKWSGVARSIHGSISIDNTDASTERNYSSNTAAHAMHSGAYWDPGMEFGTDQSEWDKPFSGTGTRLIKSHTFAHELEALKELGYPIIMVYRNDYECMNQWFNAGGFNITYPNYKPYYKNSGNMWLQIKKQNSDIMDFIQFNRSNITRAEDTYHLAELAGISKTGLGDEHHGDCYRFLDKDKQVYVYQPNTTE